MKNLFYLLLPALLLIVVSCGDQENIEEGITEFKFQKELTINDGNGNSADLVIQANSEEALADHTEDVLYLKTTTRDFSKSTNPISQEDTVDEIDVIDQNEVFIMVNSFNLNPEITGFTVLSKLEEVTSDEIETRGSSTAYEYAYGSTGINGVSVEYTAQTCNQEYLKVTLSKKNLGGLFWHKLGYGLLYTVGSDWIFDGSYSYNQFRLKIRAKLQCSGNAGYYHYWLT